jgi:hypothetical protein
MQVKPWLQHSCCAAMQVTHRGFIQPQAIMDVAVQQPELKPALPLWADVQHKPQVARQVKIGSLQAGQQDRSKLVAVCLCLRELRWQRQAPVWIHLQLSTSLLRQHTSQHLLLRLPFANNMQTCATV